MPKQKPEIISGTNLSAIQFNKQFAINKQTAILFYCLYPCFLWSTHSHYTPLPQLSGQKTYTPSTNHGKYSIMGLKIYGGNNGKEPISLTKRSKQSKLSSFCLNFDHVSFSLYLSWAGLSTNSWRIVRCIVVIHLSHPSQKLSSNISYETTWTESTNWWSPGHLAKIR